MLSFDLRSLRERAASVNGEIEADDPVWNPEDPRPAGPVRVTGRLSAAGAGRYYWHGRIEGKVALDCRRCLGETTADVEDEVHLIFAEAADPDDPDVYVIDPGARELDLRPVVREQWLLDAPAYALCRPDCKGLCPTCGTDLNAGDCDCAPVTQSRWHALRKHRGDAH
ncbi:MAG: DUF177 domain-containing protein [Gemmatimonadaceae bacterium]